MTGETLGPMELEEKLRRSLNHQARLIWPLRPTRRTEWDAVKHLIEIVNDGNGTTTAHASSSSVLEAWGATDPATIEGRKRLSSILFS
jgi:putative thioredoxin